MKCLSISLLLLMTFAVIQGEVGAPKSQEDQEDFYCDTQEDFYRDKRKYFHDEKYFGNRANEHCNEHYDNEHYYNDKKRRPVLIRALEDIYKDPSNASKIVDVLGIDINTHIPKCIVEWGEGGILGHTALSVLIKAARTGQCDLEAIESLLERRGKGHKIRSDNPGACMTPRKAAETLIISKDATEEKAACTDCRDRILALFDKFDKYKSESENPKE